MGSGGGAPTKQEVTSTSTTTNLPQYVQPYFTNLLERTQDVAFQPYTPYGGERIADFTPQQQQVQQNVMNLQAPQEFGVASQLAGAAGLGSLAMAGGYNPAQFNAGQVRAPRLQQYGMSGPSDVYAMQQEAPQMETAQTGYNPNLQNYQMQNIGDVAAREYNAPTMATARTGYNPNLQDYQMAGPEQFGQQQTERYMSPYMQNVVDVQKREAIRDAQKAQLAQNLGAVRQGTYGGSRQLLATTERERALGQQLGDIQGKGLQAAYENAQAQFERDRAAGMTTGQQNLQARLQTQQLGTQTGLQTALANLSSEQQANVQNQAAQLQTQGLNADQALRAALANQQAGLTVGQQNLQSQLQTQQLGTQTGLQAALANLSSAQQANVQNQAARLQQMGLNQQQALQAALANQQMGYNVGQQNLQAALQTQQLGSSQGLQAALANQQARLDAQKAAEASRQFGVSSGYQGLGQALQSAQTLGQLGTTGQQANLQRLQAQDLTAAQEQQMRQRYLDTAYQDFLRQQQYPMDQLSYYSSILHGIPVTPNTSSTVSQPAPSMVSQLGGLGLGALALSKMA